MASRAGRRAGGARLVLGLVLAAAAAWTQPSCLGFVMGLTHRVPPAGSQQGAVAGRTSRLPRASRGGEARESIAVGDEVTAVSAEDGQWYPGTVAKLLADGVTTVRWDDPDGGPETEEVQAANMRPVFKGYKVDDVVEAVFPDDGNMYPGKVIAANADGSFQVKWDDPDGGPEDSSCRPKDMKYPPIPLDELEVGKKYAGTVKSVRDFGCFVDIGAERDGLVHISRISTERVNDIYEHVQEGQAVDVWVDRINDGKLGLSMIEGGGGSGGGPRAPQDLTPFSEISPDEWLDGTVARVAPFGAFVTVSTPDGASQASGLVHISQLKDGFVESVESEVSEGDAVKVRVVMIDTEKNQMKLSMREEGGGFAPRPQADLSPFENLHPETWLNGKVARCAPFGAFVTVTAEGGEEADGLVHITQIRDGFIESVEDELEPGQEVKVRVVGVENGKMSLSMKPAEQY